MSPEAESSRGLREGVIMDRSDAAAGIGNRVCQKDVGDDGPADRTDLQNVELG